MPDDNSECPHGLDTRWCNLCKPPAVVAKKRPAATKARQAERKELTAADYRLPEGTPFIDTFKAEYSFLSNFSRSTIEFEGDTYATVEHAFQAAKTDDRAEREKLRHLGNPQWARREGRNVTLRPDWEQIKLDVMRDMLRMKFAIPKLAAKLVATGDARLFEGNWWGDYFWGTVNGAGENHLGRLLMEIRADLQQAIEAEEAKPVRSSTQSPGGLDESSS